VIIIKTPLQIEGIRKSSQLAAACLEYLSKQIKAGTSTNELDRLGHQYILEHKAIPAPLGYNGFPKSICTSINNVVCHGIPSDSQLLKDGDIINIDVTTILNGYYGDTSSTYPVGQISPKAEKLISVTKTSLDMAINSLYPGKRLNSCVGKVIEEYVRQSGFSPVHDLGGHGVGIKFHEEPFVFHFKTSEGDIVLKEGMIFTIEPMINASMDWHVTLDSNDGWTVRTRDGSLSAQFEHTVLITKDSCEILTKL